MSFASKSKKLTPKQEKMIAERLKNPTISNAEVIKRAGYRAKNTYLASQQYYENMKKPEIASRLAPVVDEIEDALITTVRRYKDSEELAEVKEAMANARWIHDKVRGTAIQSVNHTTTGITLNIDLTSSLGLPEQTE